MSNKESKFMPDKSTFDWLHDYINANPEAITTYRTISIMLEAYASSLRPAHDETVKIEALQEEINRLKSYKSLVENSFSIESNCSDTFYYASADSTTLYWEDHEWALPIIERFTDGDLAVFAYMRNEEVIEPRRSESYKAALEILRENKPEVKGEYGQDRSHNETGLEVTDEEISSTKTQHTDKDLREAVKFIKYLDTQNGVLHNEMWRDDKFELAFYFANFAAHMRSKLSEAGSKWISVEDRFPERDTTVICWGSKKFNEPFVACFTKMGWQEIIDGEMVTVTHWQPLPSPPASSRQGSDQNETN